MDSYRRPQNRDHFDTTLSLNLKMWWRGWLLWLLRIDIRYFVFHSWSFAIVTRCWKFHLILRTLAAHFGTSVANAVRSQRSVCTSPASGANQLSRSTMESRHELTTRLSSTASSCLFIWRGIALTVLAKHHLRLFESSFILSQLASHARRITIDSFTHRLQSGLDLPSLPALVLWNHRPSDFSFSD
jgi:hypothetical protein